MPRYSLDTCPKQETGQTNNKERKVGYFKLQPGGRAIVRFAYKSAREIEIATIHDVDIKDMHRQVLCIRDAKEPLDNCPLCASGKPIKSRAYVKLLRYELDAQDRVVAIHPEVANWPKKYADTLALRNNEYGDLQDSLFVVTRQGAKLETTYDITYANPMKYNEANGFVKDFSAFDDFDLAHHSYLEKSKEDMEEFLQSGEFPFRKKTNESADSQNPTIQQAPADVSFDTTNIRTGDINVGNGPTTNGGLLMPNGTNNTAPIQQAPGYATTTNTPPQPTAGDFMQRPRRTYDIIK